MLTSGVGSSTTIPSVPSKISCIRCRCRSSASTQEVAAMQPQRLQGVAELLEHVPAGSQLVVALDQFGVLHNGRTPYPRAVAAVKALAEAGAAIVVISNSSRRAGGTIGKLGKMGFDPAWFAGAITSGELTHRMLATRPDAWWQALGTRCIHITWSSRGAISLDGLGLTLTTDPAEADFILAHGTEAVGLPGGGATRDASLDQLAELLQHCAAQGRDIPMIVANPDLVTVDGGPGRLITMPGTLAKQYAQLGGPVQLMGKPDARIYAAARELLQASAGSTGGGDTGGGAAAGRPPAGAHQQEHDQRVVTVAIGDSVEHDIAGAARAGLQSLFIAGGIHAEEIGLFATGGDSGVTPAAGSTWDDAALARLWEQHGVTPNYVMDFLK